MAASFWRKGIALQCRRALAALVILWFCLDAPVMATCSVYAGNTSGPVNSKVAINEFNYSGDYVELKINDATVLGQTSNLQNWTLSVYTSANSRTDYPVSAALSSCPGAPAYLKLNVGNVGNDAVVVLWSDSARTQEVDYFRVGQKNYPAFQASTCFNASEFPSTSTQTYHQSLIQGSSANKDLARGPDGSGIWLTTPYNGSDQGTACANNDGTLSISKTATPGSVWLGQSVAFRVTLVLDSRAGAQSSVLVTDLLPAGFSLIGTPVVSTGSYNTGTGVWTIGNLTAGSTVTMDLNASAILVGSQVNSAAVQSNFYPSGTVTPATAAVNVLIPAITNVAVPTAVSVNGQTTFTITVTNSSASAAPAFQVTNVLDAAGLSLVSATPSTGTFAGGTWSLPGLNAGASATLTVVAKVTNSGTFTDVAQIVMNGISPPTGRAVATVSSSTSAFNAWINADKTISTQLAGSTLNLTVGAFDNGGSPASYTGNVAVSLQYCTNVARTSAGGISCGGTWADVPGMTPTNAVFAGTSTVQVTMPGPANAYEIIRVKLVPASTIPVYAADYFAVRPASLTVSAFDQDWLTAGTANLLNNTNPAQTTPVHKAGRPFSVQISTSAATSNYPGTLYSVAGLSPTATLTAPPNGVAGAFDPGTWIAVSGGAQSSTATYAEAGYFTVLLEDRHFADIDVADSTTAQRYLSGTATVGRFVPDYLTTTVTPGCGSTFSYSGQPFQVKVSAFAFGGAALKNYDSAPGFSQNVTLSNAGDSTGLTGNILQKTSFVGGVGYATLNGIKYTYPAAQAKTPLTLTLRAVDTDTVTSQGATEATTEIRSGRLWLANAYGSELLPLPVPMLLQYWTAAGWVLNTADSCTALTVPTAASGLSNALKNMTTASLKNAPALGGLVGFSFSRPGTGNTGLVDIDASVVRGGNTWLGLSAPTARACFGACGPRSPVIYMREVY